MAIRLVTGLPGAGKSLTAVEWLHNARQSGETRPIFVHGIDGLVDGIWSEIANPMDWEACPDGSMIIVDEAQKVFPALRTATLPPVRALSEHRHRGFDFMLLTQHPTLIDPYVRKLVGEHTHILRKFGTGVCERITWSEVVDDPQSIAMRKRGVSAIWRYPKEMYDLYKSSTLHNVKKRIPFKVMMLPVIILLAIVLVVFGAKYVYGIVGANKARVEAISGNVPGVGVDGKSLPSAGSVKPVPSQPKKARTAEEWAALFAPKIEGLPYSSPAYEVMNSPLPPTLYCMAAETKCICHTEQGTTYRMRDKVCRDIARYGVYDPFKPRDAERNVVDVKPNASGDRASTAVPVGIPQQVAPGSTIPAEPASTAPAGGRQWLGAPVASVR